MEQQEKIGFFKRVKKAIFNLEDYKIFANEKFSQALKYIFALIGIVTVILGIASTIQIRQEIDKLVSYVKNDFPDFTYEDETLSVEKVIEAYDEEYQALLIVDTSSELTDEQLETYKEKAKESYYSFILVDDTIYYYVDGYEYETSYGTIASYLGVDSISKTEIFENYLNDDGMFQITTVILIYAILSWFFSNILVMIEDIIVIAIFGWVASKLCKVDLSFAKNCSLATYSVTLSFLLSAAYSIATLFTGFEIQYFGLMYMIIAYIYIIAAIMIIKSDPNKTVGQEVPVHDEKPIEVEKVIESPTKKNKDKNKDKESENENNGKEEKPAEEGES